MHTAYLLVKLVAKDGKGELDTVMVTSQPAGSMVVKFGKEAYAELCHVDGKTYSEAIQNIRVIAERFFPWTIPHLDAHDAHVHATFKALGLATE